MSCIPSTPVVPSLLSDSTTDYGWQPLGAGLITTALSRYYPLFAGVVVSANLMQTTRQHGIVRQFEFEETAATKDDIKKTPLIVLLYSGQAPTTPVSGQVYNGSTTNLIGSIQITANDYKRISDTVWIATVNPDLYIRTINQSSASLINCVVLSDSSSSVTYAADAAGRIRITTQMGTAL